MPGLSQLKQFNTDILALGKETENRASRGEKPVVVPLPKSIKDIDDSEDFVLGMPEISEAEMQAAEAAPPPDDFSDITGAGSAAPVEEGVAVEEQAAPDVSNILNPIASDASGNFPDLSQFMEAPVAEEEVAAEPEEQSIADMSLDDLLGGESFEDEEVAVETFPQESQEVVEAAPEKPAQIELPPELSFLLDTTEQPPPAPPEVDLLVGTNESPAPSESNFSVGVEEPPALPDSDFSSAFDDFGASSQTIDMTSESADDFFDSDIDTDAPPADMIASTEQEPAEKQSAVAGAAIGEDFNLPDFDFASLADGSEGNAPSSAEISLGEEADFDDGGSAEMQSGDEMADMSSAQQRETAAFDTDAFDFTMESPDDEMPSFMETDAENESAQSESFEDTSLIEHFDTSAMDGLDFTVTETDKQIADESKTDFELGGFGDGNMDFEIPGFSDTTEIKTDKHGRIKLPTPDFKGAAQGDKLPKNSLTDAQYKKFLANLSEYPLNVRIAVESLLVANEFTDDAQFEIVEKILNKAPARQVASSLEKMLDIAIPVPRDFERRTAAEYNAYKASLQYQLRNKIIPGIIIGVAALVVLFALIIFTRNFIYHPLKANSLYKQGYALIEADEFPQSDMRFTEATRYQLQKKWFFKYARAYRSKKQYQRAGRMYRNILNYFNHDKEAGIEYARMECDDLANYEKAEEIAKRDVLDYHINDREGLLLLGDIYLEWATERDSTKFEEARKQYASLVQLFGTTDLYMARMMRYFVRTDNLREVLQLKERFYPKAKSLSAQDWTELSGYLLDKLYGPLAPSDEYLRTRIEDVRDMLDRAVSADPSNPIAQYNLSRYFVQMDEHERAQRMLEHTINVFNQTRTLRRRDIYKQIDSYRLLGEQYAKSKEYLKAQEAYTDGIALYEREKESSGFEGTEQIGLLYADAGDIDYFIRGDYDSALREYLTAIQTHCDTASLRYRVGFIQYSRNDYLGAINSFIRASEENATDNHVLLAMGNALSLRADDIAAQGYYERLVKNLDDERAQLGVLFPQVRSDQAEFVDLYLKASNNLGVTLHRLARRNGSSQMNATAMVNLSISMRAWDALTRNQETMTRLGGSNLAEQNMRYMSHPTPAYEPAIYTEIPRILTGEKELTQ